jgi:hypothetical protein
MAVATGVAFLIVFGLLYTTVGIIVSPQDQRDLELAVMRAVSLLVGMWSSGRVIGNLAERGVARTLVSSAIFEAALIFTPFWWRGASALGVVVLIFALLASGFAAYRGARGAQPTV